MTRKKRKQNLLYLGNKLSKHGKTPTGIEFITPKLREEGYNVLTYSDKKNKGLRFLDMCSSIIKNHRKVDVVLIDTYSTLNFWYAYVCAKIARFYSVPYICILRGGNLPEKLEKDPRRTKNLFNYAKANITLSAYLKYEFNQKGFSNLVYIPNSIAIQLYKFKLRDKIQPKLLWVRSFAEIYNPELAIFIFEELKKLYPNAELCMVGPEVNGKLEECKKLAAHKNLKVKFTGRLEKETWLQLSRDYDLFINTTNFDNTPISVIEAMALGLPVISTNVGGLPYLIEHNKDGVLVEKQKITPFVQEIQRMVEDPQRTKQFSETARKKVENFDWEVVKAKWDAVLQ
jgi:glycosyltransferase involved in cell wall biosynthesis